MKKLVFIFFSLIFFISQSVRAQKIPVNEYITVINTLNGSLKGYLEQVTDSTVSIINEKGEAVIPYQVINKIKIKSFRRKLIMSNNAEQALQKLPPNEEINNDNSEKVILTSFILSQIASDVAYTTNNEDTYVSAQIAGVALPIAGLIFANAFSNIDKFNIKGKQENYSAIKATLESYSVQYQIQ